MQRRLRTPSPALVISLIALFVSLGGTSYAAITALPKNSVGTKQLKKNAVTAPKIKNKAVTAAKINTNGLIVPRALHASSANSATNANHATNADSATNAATAAAANALNGVQYVRSAPFTNHANSVDPGDVVCPAGMFVIGGGAIGDPLTPTNQDISGSYPVEAGQTTLPNGWHVNMDNTNAVNLTFTVYAICISLTGTTSF
jgi:hypothetical protein